MRVIAGIAKGREVLAPKGLNTRPTLAKVKEAMFGMIQFDIEGARVLDLFSGSGGLGIEAISRGASFAAFCDRDRQAFAVIKENLKRFGFEDRASVDLGDSLLLLDRFAAEGKRFDIVLLDPPYKSELASQAIEKLGRLGLLSHGAIVLIEHSLDEPPVLASGFALKKTKKYGDTFVTYAIYEGA